MPAIMMLCATGTLHTSVVMPGEEATLFKVEVMEDSKALVDTDVAGIRLVFQGLAEDIMEEVEIVADEQKQ